MARKRHIFFYNRQPVLNKVNGKRVKGKGNFKQLIFIFACCLLPFSFPWGVGISPVRSEAVSTQASPEELMQRGRVFYEAGQFTDAAVVWQKAADIYADRGDGIEEAGALSNLSTALQQLGRWEEAKAAIASSLNLLNNSATNSKNSASFLARSLNARGSLQLATGQAEQALASWEQAAQAYQQAGDRNGVIRSQINQSLALQALGLYLRAVKILQQTQQLLLEQPDSLLKASGLLRLGDALRLTGDFAQSQQALQQSLEVAQKLPSPQVVSEALFSLGNTARASSNSKAAIAFYQQSILKSPTKAVKIQAQLNLLSLLVETKQWSEASPLAVNIKDELANFPASRTSVYARINLAQSLMKMEKGAGASIREGEPNRQEIAQWLAIAVQQARSLGDRIAEAHALGNLGGLYEQTQQWSNAEKLTQQALQLAQAINASEIAYRWQWQLGRLLKQEGQIDEAIAAYSEAVTTLQSLRTDLAAIDGEIQFSFRESVEPVYRQLVGLLLSPTPTAGEPSQKNLALARELIESLQIAELDNFFRDACLNAKPVQIDKVDPKAAIFYPIVLEDRLAVILSLPGQNLRYYATPLSESQVDITLQQLRQTLVIRTSQQYLAIAQQVYQWLIQPAEADLISSQVETLVFVPDGTLRNVPIAALHDGQKYVVEKYSVAVTPGLQLLQARPLQRGQLQALTAGLTESRQDFAALPNVETEVKAIKSMMPSQVLLNRDFTSETLQKEISGSSFDIVHIATHGQFSSNADETFLLTWDGRIKVNELKQLLETRNVNYNVNRAIELLVLSACQTAVGDKRAALGLAGMAVRAGARSTLATLWYIDDAATAPLMSEFYRNLTNSRGVTKAEALREAQLSLLKQPEYQHPIYWAPYVLVGNWQ